MPHADWNQPSNEFRLKDKVIVTSNRRVDDRRGSMKGLTGVIVERKYWGMDFGVRLDEYPLTCGFNANEITRVPDGASDDGCVPSRRGQRTYGADGWPNDGRC